MTQTQRDEPWDMDEAILIILAGFIGLLVRLPAALQSAYPLNDGGLFYRMILELQANGFRLPLYTTYNSSQIPFAYPPLGLYAGALLASPLHADVLDILRLVPPVVSALCIPAFYFLAKRMLPAAQPVILASTMAFALAPRAYEWQIMGGGITRAFGLLFVLLALRSAHALFTESNPKHILETGVFAGLTLLSHPEAAFQGALAAILFYLALDRSRRGAWYAALAGAIAIVVAAPWWTIVLSRYGAQPFIAAFAAARGGTAVDFPARFFLTFQFSFTQERFLPFIAILGLVGLFAELARGRWLLPLWATLPLFVEPRSAPQYMVIPLAMLAGIGLLEVILPALRGLPGMEKATSSRVSGWLLIYLAAYLVLGAYLTSSDIAKQVTLKPSDGQAFAWVRGSTPADSRFILLTRANALADPWVEWFPALTQRKSLDTVFGSEWLLDTPFSTRIQQYNDLQACLDRDESCLQSWREGPGLNYTHVLIRTNGGDSVLLESLRNSPSYTLVYERENLAIFQAHR